MSYETLISETRGAGPRRYGWIQLNRPKQLNALNEQLMDELGAALRDFERDESIACMVLTGTDKAFAAGADIKGFLPHDFASCFGQDLITRNWEHLRYCRKPVIAAVAGYALGGGCEVAMMCDFIIAADTARFGQPEIKLGVIPGAGGTQRLPAAIGKSKAMEMALTGRLMDAAEAERCGLVARVVPAADLNDEVAKTAEAICAMPMLAVLAVKDCVNRSFESGLSDGLAYERRTFHAMFSTPDKQEGMQAFVDKRPAQFTHR